MTRLLTLLSVIISTHCMCSSCNRTESNSSATKATEVVKSIKNNTTFTLSNKHITGTLDFTLAGNGAIALELSPAYINCEIIFVGCVFEDDVIAFATIGEHKQNVYSSFQRNITFRNCTFSKSLNMQQAEINGHFSFDNCHVIGEANFSGLSVNEASITESAFDDNAYFISANFNRRTSFAKTTFTRDAIFQYAHFNNISTFTDAHFGGYTDLSNAYSNALFDLTNARFGGRTTLLNATFIGQLKMAKCLFSDNLSITQCQLLGGINFTNAHLSKIFEFSDNIVASVPDFSTISKGEQCHTEIENNTTFQPIQINL